MKKKILSISILILMWTICSAFELVEINPLAKDAVSVNNLESQEDYTIVEILLNKYHKRIVEIDSKEYIELYVPSAGTSQLKGNPQLPIIARSVMIPPQAKMSIEILNYTYTEINGKVIPSKGSYEIPEDENIEIPYTFSDVYESDAFFPENIVELNDPYIL